MSRSKEQARLNKIVIAASRSLNLKETLTTVLEHTMEALEVSSGVIFLNEGESQQMHLSAYRGITSEAAERETILAPSQCQCGRALESRAPIFTHNLKHTPHCPFELCAGEGLLSVASIPLEVKGEVVGLLQLGSTKAGHFSQAQQDFLAAVAAQVSVSIENARLYEQAQRFNLELEQKVQQRTRELESARQALSEKADQLQRLLSAAYNIQEDTRERIAQDMHDGVIQLIIGALYETQAARKAMTNDPPRAVKNVERAQQLLSEAEAEIRRTIYDLHPPMLDSLGLVAATRHFAANCSASFKIACQVKSQGKTRRMEKKTELAIYRMIQAALHNVASHAAASRAQVTIQFGDTFCQVMIEDNGIGFDPEAVLRQPGEHLGLISMKERAEAINADLSIRSTPGEGSQVMLRLPSPEYLET